MPGVFICYRREDSAAYAGRLHDWISQRFGRERVFLDIDSILPGDDFARVLDQRIGSCDALIALIGKNWLTCVDEDGNRRLDDPSDFVRIEIAAALARNVRVIPVLLDGARMPSSRDLPEPLMHLARRNALELSHSRFHADVEKLIAALEIAISSPRQNESGMDERKMEGATKDEHVEPVRTEPPARPVERKQPSESPRHTDSPAAAPEPAAALPRRLAVPAAAALALGAAGAYSYWFSDVKALPASDDALDEVEVTSLLAAGFPPQDLAAWISR